MKTLKNLKSVVNTKKGQQLESKQLFHVSGGNNGDDDDDMFGLSSVTVVIRNQKKINH